MGKDEVDFVERPAEKKSLLEKYDIPVEHLSYEYITECENVKELERIVLILRSGQEGSYPDLTKHAEKRLTVLKPQSTVLRIAEPVIKRDMLAPENRIILENDINEWMSDMKLREKDLEEGRAMQLNEPIPQPAIRQIKFNEPEKNKTSSQRQKDHKRIGACDYAGWDKYDADTELNRIDLRHEQNQAEAKRAQKKLRDKEEKMKKTSREDIVNKLTLTGTELSVMAEKEREKGNEAFKAGDYEEAYQFYNSSIAIDATINAYNNRAITCVKLQRYHDAVNDCNRVLSMDYTNIKALLRRGMALDHIEKKAQALADYEAVLKLEPSNKIAITALNKLRGPCDSKKIRMKIEDGPATDKNPSAATSSVWNKAEDKNSSSVEMKIESEKIKNNSHENSAKRSSQNYSKNASDVKGSNQCLGSNDIYSTSTSQIRSKVCFCNNAPSSSQCSSPQPHFRDVYCPKVSQSFPKFPKPQSIFTDTKISSVKSSGVIIEEIPNEPCERSKEKLKSEEIKKNTKKPQDTMLTDLRSSDNSGITKKSGIVIEEIFPEKCNLKEKVVNEKIIDKTRSKTSNKYDNIPNPRKTFVNTKASSEQTSGVIIEEILDEPRARPEVHSASEKARNRPKTSQDTRTLGYQTSQDTRITKISGVVIEEVSNEKYNSKIQQKMDEKVDSNCCKISKKFTIVPKPMCEDIVISGEKTSGLTIKAIQNERSEIIEERLTCHESNDKSAKIRESVDILNFSNGKREEMINKSGTIVSKHSKEEYISTVESTRERQFEPIESPYEFLRLWHSMRNDHDFVLHASLLRALPPENIDTVIGNKLDGEMLSIILHCLEKHFCTPENSKLLPHFLQYLGKVKRFSIVRMFMDEKDKKVLQNIFSFLDGQGFPDITCDLRKIYDIPM